MKLYVVERVISFFKKKPEKPIEKNPIKRDSGFDPVSMEIVMREIEEDRDIY